ncbi:RAQPRD family integrative conjugative element protein [Suttonella ornithocola]|uniref:Integrative conjugative element protein, RAQPRD family n=1 Tax=Suttonella ornithocola TaxID=279832 RepID=A0A380MWL6_9GAMM|nr:RAQPRD family integrative conjugative element protein [Suttonella ornithocola]SUO96662.1 integrative conjugative element protein, RAQPRD family [Suttonella ornithocola]
MKFKPFLLGCLLFTLPTHADESVWQQQQRDIAEIVKELNYLIEVTKQLQINYKEDGSKIRFNYVALIAQLRAARDGAQEYLNDNLMELHTAPPPVIKSSMTKVAP